MKNILLLLLPFLFACSIRQNDVPTFVAVWPDDYLITDCDLEPPPPKDLFMKAPDNLKLKMAAEAYNTQTNNVINCNHKMDGLRKWKEGQKQLYEVYKKELEK